VVLIQAFNEETFAIAKVIRLVILPMEMLVRDVGLEQRTVGSERFREGSSQLKRAEERGVLMQLGLPGLEL